MPVFGRTKASPSKYLVLPHKHSRITRIFPPPLPAQTAVTIPAPSSSKCPLDVSDHPKQPPISKHKGNLPADAEGFQMYDKVEQIDPDINHIEDIDFYELHADLSDNESGEQGHDTLAVSNHLEHTDLSNDDPGEQGHNVSNHLEHTDLGDDDPGEQGHDALANLDGAADLD
ncbi:hypothetical protein EV702DRAFT_1202683 [Suillus placidus]|uniref:Uncharacterized protein n=1 Tax=Suillus placidus TaxID=48579 RepID=A0A9P6ZL82_9AGAM|nr:hypothetical protein EV702DRAFT_1202683 [Suillus placidus]